ncbi:MAG: hypothetical protein WBF75_12705 [Pseudonocardiaceae bacterium]
MSRVGRAVAGNIGFAGTQLAERLCEQIRAWDRDRTARPVITAYPAGTPDHELADGLVIDKQFVRLIVSG